MTRVSNIPGVYVDSIKVEGPPFNNPGIIQDFVGRGVTRDFLLEPASEVGGDRVKYFVDNAREDIGERLDRIAVKYKLLVRARTKRGARAKARAYVRIVNPFSAGAIHIESVGKTQKHSDLVEGLDPTSNFYDVVVFVAK